jgi:hypothetical protein
MIGLISPTPDPERILIVDHDGDCGRFPLGWGFKNSITAVCVP